MEERDLEPVPHRLVIGGAGRRIGLPVGRRRDVDAAREDERVEHVRVALRCALVGLVDGHDEDRVSSRLHDGARVAAVDAVRGEDPLLDGEVVRPAGDSDQRPAALSGRPTVRA